jgi:exosortase N
MNAVLNISFFHSRMVKPTALIAAGYMIIAGISLKDYLQFGSLNFLLGGLALWFISRNRQTGARSSRFVWVSILCMAICLLLPVKTLLYFSISFALLFLIESYYGKMGILPFFAILLISPVFQYLIGTFSFPIRLQLTEWVGVLFNAIGMHTVTEGNMILQAGKEFSVDPGCMGLRMMETSLLLGIILVAFYESEYEKKVKGFRLIIYFCIIVLLNILANLLRIIVLVQFSIPPETISHHVAGIACLLVYVFIPAVWLAKFIVKRSASSQPVVISQLPSVMTCPMKRLPSVIRPSAAEGLPQAKQQPSAIRYRSSVIHLLLLISTAILAVYVRNADTYKKVDLSAVPANETMTASLYAPGIVKLQDDKSLIYIKYIRGFYDTDHNPMICWKGSGYTPERMTKKNILGRTIYTTTLVNEKDQLYSAWWYSNGKNRTVDQLEWRWDMLVNGGNYAVVNITCASPADLDNAIHTIIDKRKLDIFFTKSVYH